MKRTNLDWRVVGAFGIAIAAIGAATVSVAQMSGTATDPGVRGGPPDAGGPIAGLSEQQKKLFLDGRQLFMETASVQGTVPGTRIGLGPRYDGTSCEGCHAQPAVGGGSPATNPLFQMAREGGAQNDMPPFLHMYGPASEAHFIYKSDGHTLDGGVHDLFVISGRTDAPGCNISQPDFAQEMGMNNVSLRIPLPVFGDGLVGAIPDSAITANMNSALDLKRQFGIHGTPNYDQTGTITRMGWKAADNSVLLFSFEANNVELGVTNPLYPSERDQTPGCQFNATPEDHLGYDQLGNERVSASEQIADFIRFLAPAQPGACPGGDESSCQNGFVQFVRVGCALCHTPHLVTGRSSVPALSNVRANLYSDLLLHHMGPGLADHLVAGQAQGDMFRTTPLWGEGKRIFFLHDGRTNDIVRAIEDHFSTADSEYPDSEANDVIERFNQLGQTEPKSQQDLINFLRSL